jgi:YegS/Rv2252/BmrU family lipid kinase
LFSVHPDFVIIANPVAGSGSSPLIARRAQQLIQLRGASAELLTTSGSGHAKRLAENAVAAGVPHIIGCGGDGTLQEIATALEGSNSALGILPLGRCNDFGRAVGICRSKPTDQLVDTWMSGRTRLVDLGACGERRFLTVATLGFDSEVSQFVERRKMWLKGTAAYIYGVLRVLMAFRAPEVRIRGDFGQFEGRILLAATGNTSCYGGKMEIVPGAQPDDGLLHLCLIQSVSKLHVLRMLPAVMKGRHIHDPAVRIVTSRTIEIETTEPQWICADGETLAQTPCRFEVRHAALRLLAGG